MVGGGTFRDGLGAQGSALFAIGRIKALRRLRELGPRVDHVERIDEELATLRDMLDDLLGRRRALVGASDRSFGGGHEEKRIRSRGVCPDGAQRRAIRDRDSRQPDRADYDLRRYDAVP
jgi:hypothetical protein